jgi:hypothetical protein
VSRSNIVHSTIDPRKPPTYLTATITNKGVRPLRLPFAFFSWQLPFERGAWTVNPYDAYVTPDVYVNRQTYPIEIPPRASHTCFVSDIETMRESLTQVASEAGFLGRLRFRCIRVTIITDDGALFRGRVSKQLRKEIAKIGRKAIGSPAKKPA